MRIEKTVLLGLLLIAALPALGATAQQEKMKTCNADAATRQLQGPERQDFMKSCLSAQKSSLTPQQQKMSTCSKDAAAQHLTGDARKQFMSTCLKGK